MRIFFLLMAFIFIFSCSDEHENDPVSEPPYAQLTDSIRNMPRNSSLYYRRGSMLFGNGQYQLAEMDFQKAWDLEPKEEYAVSLTAVLKQRGPEEALKFLREAIKKLPGNVFLQIGLARAYQQKNGPDSALIICSQVIKDHPNAIDAYLLKAEILEMQNRQRDALTVLETGYVYAPGDVELVHRLAFMYAESKNPKALALSDSLIDADTENRHAEPYYFKGVYYANIENYKEAIKQFDEAIRHNFNFLDAYINKGIAYFDQKKFDEAIKTFQLGIKVDPNFPDSFYWLGKTWEAKGNGEEAKLNYLKAYGLDRTMTEAKEAAERL